MVFASRFYQLSFFQPEMWKWMCKVEKFWSFSVTYQSLSFNLVFLGSFLCVTFDISDRCFFILSFETLLSSGVVSAWVWFATAEPPFSLVCIWVWLSQVVLVYLLLCLFLCFIWILTLRNKCKSHNFQMGGSPCRAWESFLNWPPHVIANQSSVRIWNWTLLPEFLIGSCSNLIDLVNQKNCRAAVMLTLNTVLSNDLHLSILDWTNGN